MEEKTNQNKKTRKNEKSLIRKTTFVTLQDYMNNTPGFQDFYKNLKKNNGPSKHKKYKQ